MTMPSEWIVGGLLIAPFVRDVLVTVVAWLALRPLLLRARLDRNFANRPLAEAGLFVIVLGLATALV